MACLGTGEEPGHNDREPAGRTSVGYRLVALPSPKTLDTFRACPPKRNTLLGRAGLVGVTVLYCSTRTPKSNTGPFSSIIPVVKQLIAKLAAWTCPCEDPSVRHLALV